MVQHDTTRSLCMDWLGRCFVAWVCGTGKTQAQHGNGTRTTWLKIQRFRSAHLLTWEPKAYCLLWYHLTLLTKNSTKMQATIGLCLSFMIFYGIIYVLNNLYFVFKHLFIYNLCDYFWIFLVKFCFQNFIFMSSWQKDLKKKKRKCSKSLKKNIRENLMKNFQQFWLIFGLLWNFLKFDPSSEIYNSISINCWQETKQTSTK